MIQNPKLKPVEVLAGVVRICGGKNTTLMGKLPLRQVQAGDAPKNGRPDQGDHFNAGDAGNLPGGAKK
ncbi:hypothetical protein [Mesorhizobium sp. B1-1-5]|uniref:hypothetical protein n=1 Tax=Mesorhizobium sp. B1-1-5 TaxID=2589979 RepID=UPI00112A885A|nr:hypothetical protein [Mesorhizobium sp. B1-1-5]TPO09888.1 hypothetical protein FJ980_10185 [Mesorhizobium sp. B1-1-5]